MLSEASNHVGVKDNTHGSIASQWAYSQRNFHRQLAEIQAQKERLIIRPRTQIIHPRPSCTNLPQQQQRLYIQADMGIQDVSQLQKRVDQIHTLLEQYKDFSTPKQTSCPTQHNSHPAQAQPDITSNEPLLNKLVSLPVSAGSENELQQQQEYPSLAFSLSMLPSDEQLSRTDSITLSTHDNQDKSDKRIDDIRQALQLAQQQERTVIRESLRLAYQRQRITATAVNFNTNEWAILNEANSENGDATKEILIPDVSIVLEKARRNQQKPRLSISPKRGKAMFLSAPPLANTRLEKPISIITSPRKPAGPLQVFTSRDERRSIIRNDDTTTKIPSVRTDAFLIKAKNTSPLKEFIRRVSIKLSPQKIPQGNGGVIPGARRSLPVSYGLRGPKALPFPQPVSRAQVKRPVALTINTQGNQSQHGSSPSSAPVVNTNTIIVKSPVGKAPESKKRVQMMSPVSSPKQNTMLPKPVESPKLCNFKPLHDESFPVKPQKSLPPATYTLPKSVTKNSFDDDDEDDDDERQTTNLRHDDTSDKHSSRPALTLSVTHLKTSETRNSFDSDSEERDSNRNNVRNRSAYIHQQTSHSSNLENISSPRLSDKGVKMGHTHAKAYESSDSSTSINQEPSHKPLKNDEVDHQVTSPSKLQDLSQGSVFAQSLVIPFRLHMKDMIPDPVSGSQLPPTQRHILVKKLLSACERRLDPSHTTSDLFDTQFDHKKMATVITAVSTGGTTTSWTCGELGITLLSVLYHTNSGLFTSNNAQSIVEYQRQFSLLEDEYRRVLSMEECDQWNALIGHIMNIIDKTSVSLQDVCYTFAMALSRDTDEDELLSPSVVSDVLRRIHSRGINFSTTTELLRLVTSPDMLLVTTLLFREEPTQNQNEDVYRLAENLITIFVHNELLIELLETAIFVNVQVYGGTFHIDGLAGALLRVYFRIYASEWLSSVLSGVTTALDTDEKLATALDAITYEDIDSIEEKDRKMFATFIDKKVLEPLINQLHNLPAHVRYTFKEVTRANIKKQSTTHSLAMINVFLYNFLYLAMEDAIEYRLQTDDMDTRHDADQIASRYHTLAQLLKEADQTFNETTDSKRIFSNKYKTSYNKSVRRLLHTIGTLDGGFTSLPRPVAMSEEGSPKLDTATQTLQKHVYQYIDDIVSQLDAMSEYEQSDTSRLSYERRSTLAVFLEKVVSDRYLKFDQSTDKALDQPSSSNIMKDLLVAAVAATSPTKLKFSKLPISLQKRNSHDSKGGEGNSNDGYNDIKRVLSNATSPVELFRSMRRSSKPL